MENVNSKFLCISVSEDSQNKKINLVGLAGENTFFTNYTPSGEFSIYVSKESAAANFFEAGKTYNLDFSKSE